MRNVNWKKKFVKNEANNFAVEFNAMGEKVNMRERERKKEHKKKLRIKSQSIGMQNSIKNALNSSIDVENNPNVVCVCLYVCIQFATMNN